MAKSKKGRPVLRRDAEEAFDIAQASTDPERTQRFMVRGMLIRAMADHNKARGYNLGRPKGTTGPTKEADDAEAIAYMEELHRQTGESKPHTLARLAFDAGKAPLGGVRASQIKRLAQRWKDRNVPK